MEVSSLFDLLSPPPPTDSPLDRSLEGGDMAICPLLELLTPHLTEIFDDVVVQGVEGMSSSGGATTSGGRRGVQLQLRVQGLVSILSTITDPSGVPISSTSTSTTSSTSSSSGGGNITSSTSGGGSGIGGGIGITSGVTSSVISGSGSLSRVVVVEWIASPVADLVADCSVGCVMQALSAPNVLRHSMVLANKPLPPKTLPSTLPPDTHKTTTSLTLPHTTVVKNESTISTSAGGALALDALLQEVASSSSVSSSSGGDGGGDTSLDDLLMSVGQEISQTLHDTTTG